MTAADGARHRLDGMFRPKSIVLVGASDNSRWARMAFRNLGIVGFEGKIFLVNRRGGEVFGQKAYTSCASIGEPVDVALLMIPSAAVADTFDDLAKAGIRNAVILSSGFAEVGHEGALLQRQLREKATALSINVIGPNTTGFVNFGGKAAMFAGTLRPPALAGHIAFLAQSGAVAGAAQIFGGQQGVGLSALVGTGNELDLGLESAIDYFLDDPATKVVCVFAETFRNPAAFKRAARKASEVGKPIVVLKVGRSEITAKAAQAHTGALVGDDRVFDAICRQYGVIRVRSLDQLLVTGDVLAKIGRFKGDRAAVISISGGISEISADIAHDEGLKLAALKPVTQEKLRAVLSSFATVNNPLDLTGAATTDFAMVENAISIVGSAPEVDLLLYVFEIPTGEDDALAFAVASLQAIGRGTRAIDKPLLVLPTTMKTMGPSSLRIAAETGVSYVSGGMETGMTAVARAVRWMQRRSSPAATQPEAAAGSTASSPGELPRSEHEAQEFLRKHGVPVVPSVLCASAGEATAAAQKMGGRVVVKIASADIAHKSDVGGVRIDIAPEDAGKAFEDIVASARKHLPKARIDGVLVSPMRRGGVEILVGITRDPQWGPVLAVGLGGIFVEILKDVSLRVLPVSEQDVMEMLGELRGARMLAGYRNTPAIDLAALARVIKSISEAAAAAGPGLQTLEVNPLLANGETIEALDALIIAEQK